MSSFFAFESEQERSLTLVPMAARMKLDTCGVKPSLKQWRQLPLEVRQSFLEQRCDCPEDVAAYRQALVSAILRYAGESPATLGDPGQPDWEDLTCVPQQLVEPSSNAGVAPPTLDQWRRLTRLQRFALLKLTRKEHPSANFLPAVREFNLA
jgi:hypothetical protein